MGWVYCLEFRVQGLGFGVGAFRFTRVAFLGYEEDMTKICFAFPRLCCSAEGF